MIPGLVMILIIIRFVACWLNVQKNLTQKLCDSAWYFSLILLLYLAGLWSTP